MGRYQKVKLRRGLRTVLPLFDIGEPGVATDSGEIFFGTTFGNVNPAQFAYVLTDGTAAGLLAGEVIPSQKIVALRDDGYGSYKLFIADETDSTEKGAVVGLAPFGASMLMAVKVISVGIVGGFVGLEPGADYFLGSNGDITLKPSSANAVYIGTALDSQTLFVNILPNSFKVAAKKTFYQAQQSGSVSTKLKPTVTDFTLLSPNNSRFSIRVDNNGNLTTAPALASSAITNFKVTKPDASEASFAVTNNGELQVLAPADAAAYLNNSFFIESPDGTAWRITVDNGNRVIAENDTSGGNYWEVTSDNGSTLFRVMEIPNTAGRALQYSALLQSAQLPAAPASIPNTVAFTFARNNQNSRTRPLFFDGGYWRNFTDSSLMHNYLSVDAGLVAGEAINSRDAVCLDFDATGVLKIYKCDRALGTRRGSFIGFATEPSAIGSPVYVKDAGFLDGFSGLTPNIAYYLGATAGSITASPQDPNPIYVGMSFSSGILTVEAKRMGMNYPTSLMGVRAHGAFTTNANTAQNTTTHYNFNTWSFGTDDNAPRQLQHSNCESQYASAGVLMTVDGYYLGAYYPQNQVYNKKTWANKPLRAGTPRHSQGAGEYNGIWVLAGGWQGFRGEAGRGDSTLDHWNGASWLEGLNSLVTSYVFGTASFQISDGIHFCGGYYYPSGGADAGWTNPHTQYNLSTAISRTGVPDNATWMNSGRISGNRGILTSRNNNIDYGYIWDGNTWSGAVPAPYIGCYPNESYSYGGGSGYNTVSQMFYTWNIYSGTYNYPTSAKFNGNSWSVDWDTNVTRVGAVGGIY